MRHWVGYGVSLRLSPAFQAEVSKGLSARILPAFSGGLKARMRLPHDGGTQAGNEHISFNDPP
jgi:hypothetical protein